MPIEIDPSQLEPISPEIDPAQLEPVGGKPKSGAYSGPPPAGIPAGLTASDLRDPEGFVRRLATVPRPAASGTIPPNAVVSEGSSSIYGRNRQFAKPGPYITKLNPQDEARFQAWVKANKVPLENDTATSDYDMRGYWKDIASKGKSETGINPVDKELHFPDTYKTPYHESFSRESRYAARNNPFEWHGETLIDQRTGRPVFQTQPRTQASSRPTYDPRAVEQLEAGGLQSPSLDPVDLLTFGAAGAGEGIAEGALNALRQGVGADVGYELMNRTSEAAAPAIAKIPGQGPAGQIARGVASQAVGVAPLIAAATLGNMRLRGDLARPYEAPESEPPAGPTETPVQPPAAETATSPAPRPESQPAPAPVSAASAPEPVELRPEDFEPVTEAPPVSQQLAPALTHLETDPNPRIAKVNNFPVDQIGTNPETFQYKENYEPKTGAGLALNVIEQFDPGLAGRLTLYRWPDGHVDVVNGHQRLAAMKRFGVPTADVQVLDSWNYTPEQARAYGARINIAEGRGTALDAASFMRDSKTSPEQLRREGIDLSESKTSDAAALYNLADPLFRAVKMKTLPPHSGIVIGSELPDNKPAQEAILKSIRELEPRGGISDAKLTEIIRLAKGGQNVTEEQTDLFGKRTLEQSLVPQQADILSHVREQLGKDKRLFGTVARERGRLESGGTNVDVGQATGISEGAATRIMMLDRSAYSRGTETNGILRKYARLLKNSPKGARAGVLKDAYAEIFDALNRDYQQAFTTAAPLPGAAPEAGPGQGNLLTGAAQPRANADAGKGYTELGGTFLPGARQFIEKDIIPSAKQAAATLRGARDSIARAFAPASMSPEAAHTAGITRKYSGILEADRERAAHAFEQARNYMETLPAADQTEFIDRIERGQAQPNLEQQQIADSIRSLLDKQRDEVQKLGQELKKPLLKNFYENYFPHIWRDPAKAEQVYNGFGSKGSLEGGKNFLKHRSFDYYIEGLQHGLEPVTTNPVDLALLKHYEMAKFLRGQRIFRDLRDADYVKFVRFGEKPPADYVKLNDKIAKVYQYSDPEKGFIARGEYYVPEPVGRIVNNYLSPGLRGDALYDALRAGSNIANRMQLGFSAFHLGTTAVNSATSDVALGLMKTAHGEPIAGLKHIGRGLSGASIISDVLRGREGYREFYNPGSIGGKVADRVADYIEANGKIGVDRQFVDGWAQSFKDALREGNVLGAVVRSPLAAAEMMGKPLFDYIIPRAKLGAFMDLAEEQLSKLPATATEADRLAVIDSVQNSIDNRFGMLQYDNLFWNNKWKDAAFLLMRAPGWNIGTTREIGGAIVDLAGRRGLTPKVAYALALPLTIMAYGAAYNYARTGKFPKLDPKDLRQSWINFTKPETGRLLPNGQPERVQFPSYLKDIEGMTEHPGKTIVDKLNPVASMLADIYQNKDYQREEIRHPGDPVLQQAGQVGKFVGEELLPFSVQNLMRRRDQSVTGKPVSQGIESYLGITPAPREFTNSAAQNLMQHFEEQNIPEGARTAAQVEHSRLMRQILQQMRAGNKESLHEALAAGEITRREAHQLGQDSLEKPFAVGFKRLTLPQAVEVYKVASNSEKDAARPFLLRKFKRDLINVPLDQRPALLKQLGSIELEWLTRKKKEGKRPGGMPLP